MNQEEMMKRINDLEIRSMNSEDNFKQISAKLQDLHTISVKKDEFLKNNELIDAKIPANRELVKQIQNETVLRCDNLSSSYDTFKSQIDSLFQRVMKLEDSTQNIRNYIDSMLVRIQEQEKSSLRNSQSLSDLQKSHAYECQIRKESDIRLSQLSEDHRSSLDKINSCKDLQKKSLETEDRISLDLKRAFAQLFEVSTYVHTNFVVLKDQLAQNIRQVQSSFETKFDQIKFPEPEDKVDVKAEVQSHVDDMQEKLGSIHLDIENSILKSNNNELQMRVFEKKLENIYLLLKKHEITR